MILVEFIMPQYDNNGTPQGNVHGTFKRRLVREFGGFTAYDVSGQWFEEETQKTYNDASTAYRVAVEERDLDRIRNFALDFGRALNQISVFFSVIGSAEIISTEEKADNAKS